MGVTDRLLGAPPPHGPDALLVTKQPQSEVRLESEIAGLTEFAARTAQLTAHCDYPVLCACRTSFYTARHVSVFTFAGGRLADIADRTVSLEGGYNEGDTLKILRLPRLRLALLVDTDILSVKNWRHVADQCDAVISIGDTPTVDHEYLPVLSERFHKPYVAAFAGGEILWGET